MIEVFGPVPSRRLGRSLGINNIPAKICTYSCIYCQIGHNTKTQIGREGFYNPKDTIKTIKEKINKLSELNEKVDYITFVSDGEPTLDKSIGYIASELKELSIKTAIITNSSLIWKDGVRKDLTNFDTVSVKIDTVNPNIWSKINRPHKHLNLDNILSGITEFSNNFTGKLITETMLVNGVNDNKEDIINTAEFIAKLNIPTSYISIPTRPPTEKWVTASDEHKIGEVYQIFSNKGIKTEYLIGYEGNAFATTNSNVTDDLLSITSVHPMREDAVRELLNKKSVDFSVIKDLINKDLLVETIYNDKKYYIRKIK
jgi:wyosine [tRNA(Phe)-imidazoG37] synthetase (radical SAM superfamily)